jgi:hypothetical protein
MNISMLLAAGGRFSSESPSSFLLGCRFFDVVPPKEIQKQSRPESKQLHLLSVGHRSYFTPDNFQAVN